MFQNLKDNIIKFNDGRGELSVIYEHKNIVIKKSFSRAHVFRGMHFQRAPMKQTKLIRVINGEIVDIIFNPEIKPFTFYVKTIKASENWIGIGDEFAHGFYAVKDTEFEYICIGGYSEAHEATYNITQFLEDELDLSNLVLSKKDRHAPKVETFGSVVTYVE